MPVHFSEVVLIVSTKVGKIHMNTHIYTAKKIERPSNMAQHNTAEILRQLLKNELHSGGIRTHHMHSRCAASPTRQLS